MQLTRSGVCVCVCMHLCVTLVESSALLKSFINDIPCCSGTTHTPSLSLTVSVCVHDIISIFTRI